MGAVRTASCPVGLGQTRGAAEDAGPVVTAISPDARPSGISPASAIVLRLTGLRSVAAGNTPVSTPRFPRTLERGPQPLEATGAEPDDFEAELELRQLRVRGQPGLGGSPHAALLLHTHPLAPADA